MGLRYIDRSVAALSAGQAGGTASVLSANPRRVGLVVVPAADASLLIAAGAARGVPLIGALPNTFMGTEAPTNELFLSGLLTGQGVTIWEANEGDW
jgi:hypothetical protein